MTFYNPLFPPNEEESTSAAGAVESTSSFSVEDPNHCPKCSSATVPTFLKDGETVMFCTNCRVSMAIPE